MRSVVIPTLVAAVLALAGAAFYIAGHADRRVAELHQQLATLQYSTAAETGGDLEGSLDLERRVPVVGPQAAADVHAAATTARYWQSNYTAVQPQKDANGTVTESDPAVLLISANAAFRASQAAADRADTLRRLDAAVKSYSDALRANGQQIDTAYNYEYAVRVRDALGKAKPGAPAKAAAKQAQAPAESSDLPSGPTLHGRPGAPPTKTEMSQFKIVIPKRGDERKDNPEAGKGGQKIRKG
jgi:hypothetical protein